MSCTRSTTETGNSRPVRQLRLVLTGPTEFPDRAGGAEARRGWSACLPCRTVPYCAVSYFSGLFLVAASRACHDVTGQFYTNTVRTRWVRILSVPVPGYYAYLTPSVSWVYSIPSCMPV